MDLVLSRACRPPILTAFFQLFYAFLIFPRWPYLASQFLPLSCPVGPLRKLAFVTFDTYIARVFLTLLMLFFLST